MTPPAESAAAMIRPAPVRRDSKVNRDLLRVMEGFSFGWLGLFLLAVGFMLAAAHDRVCRCASRSRGLQTPR
jgi:hypothetical protein